MPLPYSPFMQETIKSEVLDTKPLIATYSDSNLEDANHDPFTGSFKYDPIGFPLKSTQQLNVDWSKFENHCFFSSAEVRVNEAFDKIINFYPFDGSKKEVEEFLDSLSGFEKWIFDRFPRWSGALHFSGTQIGESGGGGTYVTVKDKSGYLLPEVSRNNTGVTVINPPDDETSQTFEALIYLPERDNGTQIVFQKTSSASEGITFYLKPDSSTSKAEGVFAVNSGNQRNAVSGTLQKGYFNHVCLTNNKDTNTLQFYLNQTLTATSILVNLPKLDIDNSDLLIGSGSSFYETNTLITPTQTFSGTIDEFRVFHSTRDASKQLLNISRGIYQTSDLKLYYRFNEPSGSLSTNSTADAIVLDSSGNSLHGSISNYSSSLRINMNSFESKNVMSQEKKDFQIILFPSYADVVDLNNSLLMSASEYDKANPNNIIRLVPPHYLLEGAQKDGFDNSSVEGDGGLPYGGDGIPGQGKKGSVQLILTFLYIWSRFFDEIKTYIDAFVSLRTVDYEDEGSIPDNFLEDIVKLYGFYLPRFFTNSTIEQYAEGQNIEGLTDINTPLKKIQAILTKRLLINLPNIIRSKGTHHSIKAFLRSIGIDPENSVKIREYGGPRIRQLSSSREKRTEPLSMIDVTENVHIQSTYLSASRVEPGFPEPSGYFLYDDQGNRIGTSNRSDGLLTSGSWHLEAIFKIPSSKLNSEKQSLFRLMSTGSASSQGLLANVVAYPSSYKGDTSKISAFVRPGNGASSPVFRLDLDLDSEGIFDGDKWNVSFGCFRNDAIESTASSSYYLRAGRAEQGQIAESYVTSSYFYEKSISSGEKNLFREIDLTNNSSGTFISLGPGIEINPSISQPFLNNSLMVDSDARTTAFSGWISSLRFWSKGLSVDEWKEHIRNPKSAGVSNPKVNYNFVNNVSGSFEKLRLETLIKQQTKSSDAYGDIEFLDYSLNNIETTTGTGFPISSLVTVGDVMTYSYLSTKIDEASTDDKIRIKSFENVQNLIENPDAIPVQYVDYESYLKEEPQDDLRLSLEFSMIDSLSKDMVGMFSDYEILNDMLGRPELMFSPDYPDLEIMRDVYFKRLSGKPDFKKFFEFYRWFDASITGFIDQLIPSKTRFKGTNFVVESHLLERHKNMYKHDENYLGKKQIIQDSLRVQQIVGNLRKY